MKKIVSLILVITALCALTFSAAAAQPVAGKKTATAYVGDVLIDGKIDAAWEYAPVIKVDTVKQNASAWYGDTSKVAGKDYAVCNAKILWDGQKTLYVLYEVQDKVISFSGTNGWEKDSIELFLNINNPSAKEAVKYQSRIFAKDGEAPSGQVVDCAYAKTDAGFIYELAVNIEPFIGNGDYFGIDFQYNDDAEGKGVRNVCLGWSDSIDQASKDASAHGQCQLSKTTVAQLKADATAPATFDPAVLGAIVMLTSGAAVIVCKKKK